MQPLFVLIAAIVKTAMRIMGWRMQVEGDEHLPAHGPAILATNHVGYADPLQIGWVVHRHGRVPRFLAKQELFGHRLLGPVLRHLRQVPVDRRGDRAAALPYAEALLREGEWVVVFPEGTISRSFVPTQPRTGAARLALATGAPLVPVALWGSHRIFTKGRPRDIRRDVVWSVRIGEPVPYEPDEDPVALTERLWAAVTELVDRAQRTYPQQPADDADRWWLPRHLGGSAPSVEEAEAWARDEGAARRARDQCDASEARDDAGSADG